MRELESDIEELKQLDLQALRRAKLSEEATRCEQHIDEFEKLCTAARITKHFVEKDSRQLYYSTECAASRKR